jgi:hypothetical protein
MRRDLATLLPFAILMAIYVAGKFGYKNEVLFWAFVIVLFALPFWTVLVQPDRWRGLLIGPGLAIATALVVLAWKWIFKGPGRWGPAPFVATFVLLLLYLGYCVLVVVVVSSRKGKRV